MSARERLREAVRALRRAVLDPGREEPLCADLGAVADLLAVVADLLERGYTGPDRRVADEPWRIPARVGSEPLRFDSITPHESHGMEAEDGSKLRIFGWRNDGGMLLLFATTKDEALQKLRRLMGRRRADWQT